MDIAKRVLWYENIVEYSHYYDTQWEYNSAAKPILIDDVTLNIMFIKFIHVHVIDNHIPNGGY